MGKYNIWVYAICKNEEQFVEGWMDSMSEADGVLVVDTGSTDQSVEKLKLRGAVVYEQVFTPWRFDHARNAALDLIPKEVDICVSTDLDEVLLPGWRQVLEDQWGSGVDRGNFLYNFELDANGNPVLQFQREKIHTRHNYRWFSPVHERLAYTGEGKEQLKFLEGVVLNHYPDTTKPRTQYLPLLELTVEENPQDDRAMFWLGREYIYQNQPEAAITTLKRHLALPTAIWDEERCASMRLLGNCYEAKGEWATAQNWYFKAVGECPYVREPYLELAKFGQKTQNWPLTYGMAREALKIGKKTGSYLTDEKCWSFYFDDAAALAAYFLGMYKEAVEHGNRALLLSPHDSRLVENLKFYYGKMIEGG